jgi:3'-phosphoadenosine 5'-phosphosulfate (PAPS) 3'-phosphatase
MQRNSYSKKIYSATAQQKKFAERERDEGDGEREREREREREEKEEEEGEEDEEDEEEKEAINTSIVLNRFPTYFKMSTEFAYAPGEEIARLVFIIQ